MLKARTSITTMIIGSALGLATSGCTGDTTGSNTENATACTVTNRLTGEPIGPEELLKFDDPIANILLATGGCPSSYAGIMQTFAKHDTEACKFDPVQSYLVDDGARLGNKRKFLRTVTTRQCGGRESHEYFSTLLGTRPDEDLSNHSFVEQMAWDATAKTFNFWSMSGTSWTFHGTSITLAPENRDCGSCHRGGGPIMKELDRPWSSWHLDKEVLPTKSSETDDDYFTGQGKKEYDRDDVLGLLTDAAVLEATVRNGTRAFNESRINFNHQPGNAVEGSEIRSNVRELLRPLFCSVEFNLDAASDTLHGPIHEVPLDFLLDPLLFPGNGQGLPMSNDVYQSVISSERVNQSISGFPDHNDRPYKMPYPERSAADIDFVTQLFERGLVSREMITDVLVIDFTRALHSTQRCALLDYAPKFAELDEEGEPTTGDDPRFITEVTPESIRLGFIAALDQLETRSAVEQQLLDNLNTPDQAKLHRAAVAEFVNACVARPQKDLMEDLIVVAAQISNLASDGEFGGLIEHNEQLAQTNLFPTEEESRLDQTSCALKAPATE